MFSPRILLFVGAAVASNADAASRLTVFNLLSQPQTVTLISPSETIEITVEAESSSGYVSLEPAQYALETHYDGTLVSSSLALTDEGDFSAALALNEVLVPHFFLARDHNYPVVPMSLQTMHLAPGLTSSDARLLEECLQQDGSLDRSSSESIGFGDGTLESVGGLRAGFRHVYSTRGGSSCRLHALAGQQIVASGDALIPDQADGEVYRVFLIGNTREELRFLTFLQETRQTRARATMGAVIDGTLLSARQRVGRAMAMFENVPAPDALPYGPSNVAAIIFDYDDDGQPIWHVADGVTDPNFSERMLLKLTRTSRSDAGFISTERMGFSWVISHRCGATLVEQFRTGQPPPPLPPYLHDADSFDAMDCEVSP